MSRLWRYKGYDPDARRLKKGFEYKSPEIFTLESPGEDYEDVTTEQFLIEKEASSYPGRKIIGNAYVDRMDARLVLLGRAIPNKALSESVRAIIDGMFKGTRDYISIGRFKSADREIDKVDPNENLQMLVDQFQLPIDQEALIQEIKDFTHSQAKLY